MLDVIHYFYEADNRYVGHDEAVITDAFRTNVYKEFYNVDYRYAVAEGSSSGSSEYDFSDIDGPEDYGTFESEEIFKPFNPKAPELKPYVPPTDFDSSGDSPFGSILDAPIA